MWLWRCRHDSGCCNRPYLRRSPQLQRPCAGVERRAGRAHIVYQDDDATPDGGGAPAEREGGPDVAMPPGGWEVGLWTCGADAPQRVDDRQAQVTRKIAGLVESALVVSRPMQRHRHYPASALQDIMTALPHQRAEWFCQGSAAAVLQGVDDRTQCPFVRTRGAGAIDESGKAPAAGATRLRHTDHAPCGERVAAGVAERRWQTCD